MIRRAALLQDALMLLQHLQTLPALRVLSAETRWQFAIQLQSAAQLPEKPTATAALQLAQHIIDATRTLPEIAEQLPRLITDLYHLRSRTVPFQVTGNATVRAAYWRSEIAVLCLAMQAVVEVLLSPT